MATKRRRFSTIMSGEQTRIDLNPMLDVVFILLIFFIVTSVFIRERGLDANSNPNNEPRPDSKRPVIVQITATDGIYIEKKPVDVRRVGANLTRLGAERDNPSVVIDAHPSSSVDALVSVMDQSRDAGLYAISFAQR